MIRIYVPVLVLISTVSTGCSLYSGNVNGGWNFYSNAERNLVVYPTRFLDDVCLNWKVKHHAHAAWRAYKAGCPGTTFSSAFAEGFIAGFRDYVESGGTGLAPAVPPLKYQLASHRRPDSYNLTQDWFAGFQAGASRAKSSGLREESLVPLSDIPADHNASTHDITPPVNGNHGSAAMYPSTTRYQPAPTTSETTTAPVTPLEANPQSQILMPKP